VQRDKIKIKRDRYRGTPGLHCDDTRRISILEFSSFRSESRGKSAFLARWEHPALASLRFTHLQRANARTQRSIDIPYDVPGDGNSHSKSRRTCLIRPKEAFMDRAEMLIFSEALQRRSSPSRSSQGNNIARFLFPAFSRYGWIFSTGDLYELLA